jgi:hypothetical protein
MINNEKTYLYTREDEIAFEQLDVIRFLYLNFEESAYITNLRTKETVCYFIFKTLKRNRFP